MTGGVRIVSGRFRGRLLETPPGNSTRPLLTRLRKSLADILRPILPGAGVLELFGGSGAISFELLSNGAAHALIVEQEKGAAAVIRANAKKLGAQAVVEEGDCVRLLPSLARRNRPFEIAIVAPPYGKGLQAAAMEALASARVLAPGATAVVQREDAEPLWEPSGGFSLERTREYGRTVFDFYRWEP